MNFEIRIFANPAGFREIKLRAPYGSYRLCTDHIISSRNFDGDRGRFPDGTFSVFYTPDCYVIAYKFSVPSDSSFRDREAHVVIAIARGYKMSDPAATFSALAREFSNIASEFKEDSERNAYANSEKFYEFVASKIKPDNTQFNINTAGSYTKRGILAVDSNEELDSFLEDPFRTEIKGLDIIFVLPRDEAKRLASYTTSGLYTAISRLGAKTYTLVYPDGKKVSFSDFNEILDSHVVQRPYEKELVFSGNIAENFTKWDIKVSSDKTEYIIGIQPEKEIKEIDVEIFDNNTKNPITNVNVNFSIGEYRDGKWILKGEEIGKYNSVKITNPGYNMKSCTLKDNSILTILLVKCYNYDILNLVKSIHEETGLNNIPISICYKDIFGKPRSCFRYESGADTKFTAEFPPSELFIIVSATPTTEETPLRFDSTGRVSDTKLIPKQTCDVVISFDSKDEQILKKRLLKQHEVGTVFYSYSIGGSKKKINEKCIDSVPVEIKGLPIQEVQITIRITGFKDCNETVKLNAKRKEITCTLQPTTMTRVKKFCTTSLPFVIVGIILGILMCFYVLDTWNALLPSNKDLRDEIHRLRADSTKQAKEIQNLREFYTKVGPVADQDQETAPALEEPIQLNANQQELIKKLKGVEFTWADVNNAKTQLRGLNQESLINDATACLKILNLSIEEKLQVNTTGTTTYNLTVKNLTTHKSIMSDITNNPAYQTCTTTNFQTIEAMQQYLNDNANLK